jgi:hypothetical protein
MKLPAIIKLNRKNTLISTGPTINRNIHFGLEGAGQSVASPDHEVGSDGWVVGDLLEVDGTAVDPGLVGFTENGVEGFLHGEVDE